MKTRNLTNQIWAEYVRGQIKKLKKLNGRKMRRLLILSKNGSGDLSREESILSYEIEAISEALIAIENFLEDFSTIYAEAIHQMIQLQDEVDKLRKQSQDLVALFDQAADGESLYLEMLKNAIKNGN